MWALIESLQEHLASIVALITALIALYNWGAKPLRKMMERDKQQEEDLADLLWDRLQQAHGHFMKQGWCTPAEKERLITMHRHYSAKGRNHLSDNYERDILGLPESPAERSNV